MPKVHKNNTPFDRIDFYQNPNNRPNKMELERFLWKPFQLNNIDSLKNKCFDKNCSPSIHAAINILSKKRNTPDINGGLRSVVEAVSPSIDSVSAEITAYILRGDIIDFIRKEPDIFYNYHLTSSKKEFNNYCKKFISGNSKIGEFELMVLSEIFERPIHIYGGKELIEFGAFWKNNEPINLHYDMESGAYIAKR